MADVDNEFLITLVQARPVLWDKFLAIYKDRNATKSAWREVCIELRSDFDSLDDMVKNEFGKEVVRRWNNLRDSFSKFKKKDEERKRSGSPAKRHKKYVYFNELQFLDKLYVPRETLNSPEPSIKQGREEEERIAPKPHASDDGLDVCTPLSKRPTSGPTPKATKPHEPDEIELRILKVLEEEKRCSKMAFLQSLMPHLQKFDDQEFLQFQMGVLKVIEHINETKKGVHLHTQHHLSHASFLQQFLARPQPFFDHPSTSTQSFSQPIFNTPPQYPLYQQPLNSSDISANKEPPSAASSFHGFSQRASTESERSYSPSIHSVESSSVAENIDSGTSN